MAGRLSTRTKIVDRADQAGAEKMMPDPVDHDSGQQAVLRVDEPLGQLQAAARFLETLIQPFQISMAVDSTGRRGRSH